VIVDSSALLAVVWNEPEAERLARALQAAPMRRIGVVNWFESMMVAEARSGAASARALLLTLADLDIQPLAFDQDQMLAAYGAWQRFGKGRHPAQLNLGDCCAYAAAVVNGEPLLFKGDDFSRTDVPAAVW
jgi:ribonuclease VapC